jgi:hypothetical protein
VLSWLIGQQLFWCTAFGALRAVQNPLTSLADASHASLAFQQRAVSDLIDEAAKGSAR